MIKTYIGILGVGDEVYNLKTGNNGVVTDMSRKHIIITWDTGSIAQYTRKLDYWVIRKSKLFDIQ